MRTDRTRAEYILEELRTGKLRQGWGYRENLNLETLARLVSSGEPLTSEERAAWRNRRLLPTESSSIQEGDILLLPSFAELRLKGSWFIAEVKITNTGSKSTRYSMTMGTSETFSL